MAADPFSLPKDSHYISLESTIGNQISGGDPLGKATSSEDFAREVVNDVISGRAGVTYRGSLAWASPWIGMLPQWYKVCMLHPSDLSIPEI